MFMLNQRDLSALTARNELVKCNGRPSSITSVRISALLKTSYLDVNPRKVSTRSEYTRMIKTDVAN